MADRRRSLGIPAGVTFDFAGSIAPYGYLLCFGQEVSRTEYAALFAAIGTIYGSGDGSTTFNVPDCRGRVKAGKDDMGGTAASRLTTAGAGIDGVALGAAGGAQTHTLTTAQLASHNHTQGSHTHQWEISINPGSVANSAYATNGGTPGNGTPLSGTGIVTTTATTPAINTNGSGSAHQNTQPTIVFNTIIKI